MSIMNPEIIVFLGDISHLVKLQSSHWATLRPKNLENIRNFERDEACPPVAYKRKCHLVFVKSTLS